MPVLTQKELKRLLDYDPYIGVFRWKVHRKNGQIKAGFIAGTKNSQGYIDISINKKRYKAHHLAWLWMTGYLPKWPKDEMDHINHNRADNRFDNLRLTNHKKNKRNAPLYKNNKSGYHGVNWCPRYKKWRARIRNIHLGYFHRKSKAIAIRKIAEVEYGFHLNHGK